MPVDNGDAPVSGFLPSLINSMAAFPKIVDNPMDNQHIQLKSLD
jgi:hypothetical protein